MKLSNRANLWALSVALFGVACSQGDEHDFLGPADPANPTVARVIVTPQIGTLETDEPLRFYAFGRGPSGDSVALAVDWSSTGGTITADGFFAASTPGTYQVVARVQGQPDKADSAAVAVLAGSNEIVDVAVSPGFAVVAPGGSVQFSAITQFKDGTTGTGPVFWIGGDGSIDASGLFVAPDTVGVFDIIAASPNGHADTAQVRIVRDVLLSGLTVSPKVATVVSGEDQQMQGIASWSDGSSTEPALDWSSDGGTIDENGLFTAGAAPGAFTIIATRRGGPGSDTAKVVIPPTTVIGLTISPSTAAFQPGANQLFSALAAMSDGTSRSANVTWQATGGTINTAGGYVAGSAAGSYQVTATLVGGSLTATANVSIASSVSALLSVIVNPSSTTLGVGQSKQFAVAATWADGGTQVPPVVWSATGGTISSSGNYVAGTVPGSYRVVATHQGGSKADTASVTISGAALTQLALTPATVSVVKGATVQFVASGQWSDGSTSSPALTYSISGGGSISGSGLFTAGTSTGTYQVIGRHAPSGLADTSFVTVVSPAVTLRSLTINPANVTMGSSRVQLFSVAGQWSDGSTTMPPVVWSTNGGSITSSGRYTSPDGKGTYRVVARHQGGTLADTAVVQVTGTTPVLTAIIVSPTSTTLQPNGIKQFSVSGVWTNGGIGTPSVTYAATGGTITAGGLYTAGGVAGTYRVIATQQGGTLADTAVVTIATGAPQLTAITVTPAGASVKSGTSQQYAATGTWSNGGTAAPSVTWSATGGTITAGGLFTASQTTGTFRVIAKEAGGTLADTVAVSVTSQSAVLTGITVAPKPVTMSTTTTQQFAASGTWSNGGTGTPLVLWTATGGTVTSNGRYSAGSVPGTYHVVATQQGGVLTDTAVVTVVSPVLTAVTISPSPATVPGGQTKQFSVQGTWSDGVSRPVVVNYSATGGTVSANGLYSAGQVAGTFMVVAACGCGPADTAVVNVTSPTAPTLTALNLTPATAAVVVGGTQQFTATPVWSGGTGTAPTITFTATGGTISASGIFTGGNTVGTYKVIASALNGTVADTAAVSITPVPPPPPTSGARANEPAGLSLVTMQDWAAKVTTGGPSPGRWTQDGQSAANTTSPISPTGSGWDPGIKAEQVRFPSGHAGGTAPDQTRYYFPAGGDKKELYIHYQMQFGTFLNPNVQTKHLWIGRTGDQGSGFFFQFKKSGSYATAADQNSPEDAYISMNSQGLPNSNRLLTANQGWTVNFNNGSKQVHRVEIYIKGNTNGVADGIVKMWIDGRLFFSYSDVVFFGAGWGAHPTFDRVEIEHTYGGGSTPVPSGANYDINVGPVYISGR